MKVIWEEVEIKTKHGTLVARGVVEGGYDIPYEIFRLSSGTLFKIDYGAFKSIGFSFDKGCTCDDSAGLWPSVDAAKKAVERHIEILTQRQQPVIIQPDYTI